MADLTSSLRQMRGPFLTDEVVPTGNQVPSMGAMQSGLTSALSNISAGATAREAFTAEQAGNTATSSALRARAGQLAAEAEQEAPRVRSYQDIHGIGDAAEYLAGGIGGMLPYIPPTIAGAVAGRVLGPSALRAVTPAIGASAAMYPLEKGQAVLDQYQDPVQAAAPIDQRDAVATTRAGINALLTGGAGSSVLRGAMGRRLSGSAAAGALEAGLPLVAAHGVATEAQNYLNPNRDTSHDNAGYIDAAIQGGLLGAAGHAPSAMAQTGVRGAKAVGEGVKNVATAVKDTAAEGAQAATEAARPTVEGLKGALGEAASTVGERVVEPTVERARDAYGRFKPRATDFAHDAATFAEDAVNKFTEAVQQAKDFPDFMRHVFSSEQSDGVTEAYNLTLGDKSPEFKGPDGKVDEAKLFASDEPRRKKHEEYAGSLLNDPAVSEEVKKKVASYNGDYSTPEAQSYVSNAMLAKRSGERAADAIKALRKGTEELLKAVKTKAPEAKKALGDAVEAGKDAIIKKSAMEPKTQLAVEEHIFKGLRDELQAQPAVLKQVPELRKIITNLFSQGTEVSDQTLKTFGGFHAMDYLFKDKDATLDAVAKALGTDNLYKRTSKFMSATEDIKKADSMLYRAIPLERREQLTAPMLQRVARLVDSASHLDENKYKMAVDGLGRELFGSREAAQAVFDYYTRKNKAEMQFEDDSRPHTGLAEDVKERPQEQAAHGINEAQLDSNYVFSSVKKELERPFHSSEMRNLVDRIEASRGTGSSEIMNMAEMAYREGRNPIAELSRIEKDIRQRIKDHKEHKEYREGTPEQKEYRKGMIKRLQDQLDGIKIRKEEVANDPQFMEGTDPEFAKEMAASNALQDFHVGKITGEKADKMVADDEFIRDSGFGYSKMRPEERKRRAAEFIEFEKADGKTLTLHAPSMVKAMGQRQGAKEGELPAARSARLLKEAIASVRLRDDIVALKTPINDIKFNASMALKDVEAAQMHPTKEVIAANRAFREAQNAFDKNLEEMRALITKVKAGVRTDLTSRFAQLALEREELKAKMAEARNRGADDPRPDKTEKQERETQGLTDIQKELIEAQGGTRLEQEMGERRANDAATVSPGVYEKDQPRTVKGESLGTEYTDADRRNAKGELPEMTKMERLSKEGKAVRGEDGVYRLTDKADLDRLGGTTKDGDIYVNPAAIEADFKAGFEYPFSTPRLRLVQDRAATPKSWYQENIKTVKDYERLVAEHERAHKELGHEHSERNSEKDIAQEIAAQSVAAEKFELGKQKGAELPGESISKKEMTTGGSNDPVVKKSLLSTQIHNELGLEGIPATHDSPHKFDQFDWRKHKYKGEGAMMFGAGTYLSSRDSVHRNYKKKFSSDGKEEALYYARNDVKLYTKDTYKFKNALDVSKWSEPEKWYTQDGIETEMRTFLMEHGTDEDVPNYDYLIKDPRTGKWAHVDSMEMDASSYDEYPIFSGKQFDTPEEAVKFIYSGKLEESEKALKRAQEELAQLESKADKPPTYHVTIKAKPEELMNWDARFDEQSPQVQNALKKLLGKNITDELQWSHDPVLPYTWFAAKDIEGDYNQAYRYFKITRERAGRFRGEVSIESDRGSTMERTVYGASLSEVQNLLQEDLVSKYPKASELYKRLAEKLGSQEAASDALQKAGIPGHRFNAIGGREEKFPNYVMYDDSPNRLQTNYVHFSKENSSAGRDITPEEAQAVRDHVLKTRGPDVKVLTDQFAKDIGGSGEYFKQGAERVIKVARDALNPLSTAYHESMHDFFHTLINEGDGKALKEKLLRAADLPIVQAQLRILLRNHPEALKQVLNDPEERLSYMYQFWATPGADGKPMLKLTPESRNIFQKIAKLFRDVLGTVSRGEQAEAILQAFHDGRLSEPSTAGAIIADMQMRTIGDKMDSLVGPFRNNVGKLLTPATERLRSFGYSSLNEIADKFHKEPDREGGGLGFIQKRAQEQGKFANKLQDILATSTAEQRAQALAELQGMVKPTSEIGQKMRALLDDLHDYMAEAGVKTVDEIIEGKPAWVPIQKIKDYFPRVWDRGIIRARQEEFKQLLMTEGKMDGTAADAIIKSALSGDGFGELAETERHVGFTPYSSAVKHRQLRFITKANAAKFAEFQNKDIVNIMHTYIYQAAHRGEYARFFGNDGEQIQAALKAAERQGATEKEIMEAAKAVRAMEGTLGADINPRLRELYSGVVGYENIVLLPFALFSSLIDPLGIAVRSGSMKDAAIAFKDGVKGLFQDLLRMDKDAEYEMTRTLGIIDNLNQLEAMGQLMNSQYMSKGMRKFNEGFFKWNGMQTWNERMRVSAMGAGMRFIVRNKNNERYMNELGLQPGDIKELSDGRIARTMDEGLSKEQEQRVHEALFKFVDGAILRPNAAHRPPWTSDPHYMLIAHLKQYTFSFQQTILKQVKKEFMNGNNYPLYVLAAYVPFMAASDLIRGSITGSIKNSWTVGDFFADGVARSGILGTGSFVTDAMKDASMGSAPGSSFLGPAGQHAILAAKTAMGAPGVDWGDLALRSLPASPLFKAGL